MRKSTKKSKKEDKKKCPLAVRAAGKLTLGALLLFVGTFTVYMTNAENKLIYRVVRPFLTRHYDRQSRDRRI